MPEEILPHLYRIEVPLPRHPMKATNSYAILSEPRNLVIDTGVRSEESLAYLLGRLGDIGIDVRRTDFFITHYHSDHFGLVPELLDYRVQVFMSTPEIARLQSGPFWEALITYARSWGYAEDNLHKLLLAFRAAYRFDPALGRDLIPVSEGDTLSYDQYTFSCVLTPGHTPGHTCLYEPCHGLLVCGDHLLPDVAPFIQVWSDRGNPLQDHFESLALTNRLNPRHVLPGHGRVFRNASARTAQVKRWHEKRAARVLASLRKHPMTVVEAAAQIRSKSGPVISDGYVNAFHQFIEVAETMAYLRYLERDRLVEESVVNGTLTYAAR